MFIKQGDYNVEGKAYVINDLSSRKVKVRRLDSNAMLPVENKKESMSIDLYSCTSERILVMPHETTEIHTGIAVKLPKDTFKGIFARNGLACKKGLALTNKVGVIDSNYRGEVIVALHNDSDLPQMVEPMEKIAQLVILSYIQAELEEVEELSDAEVALVPLKNTNLIIIYIIINFNISKK